jgi:mannose-6-phosphate isomerase-like protein (cupin superfamily)
MIAAVAAVAGCVMLAHDTAAQGAPRPVRVVIASERLAAVNDAPRHFHVLRVDLPRGKPATFAGPNGYVYVLSGKPSLASGADQRSLVPGEGAFLREGDAVRLQGPAVLVHFLLESGAAATGYAGAKVTELYRTAEPVPGLEPGPHEFSLTKVISPPGVKPPLHRRSGAAIYYVLEGAGTLHMESGKEPRKSGMVQYEPKTFVHTWENSGSAPLVLLQANLSREGTPEIIFLR